MNYYLLGFVYLIQNCPIQGATQSGERLIQATNLQAAVGILNTMIGQNLTLVTTEGQIGIFNKTNLIA